MPPYWDTKALLHPNPTQYLFSTFKLFPSFLLKINAFPIRFEKGEKKFGQRWIRTRVDHVNKHAL